MKRFIFSALITSLFAVQAAHSQELKATNPTFRPDMGKALIERPVKSLLTLPASLKSESLPTSEIAKKETKKKVKPGSVIWYPTTAQAKKNSLLSGKPVLVFHLMGFLDDRFC